MSGKKITLVAVIIFGAILAGIFFLGAKNTPNSDFTANSLSSASSTVPNNQLKKYVDEKHGITFEYPEKFDVEKSVDIDGKSRITIDPFNSDPDNRNMKESVGLLTFSFLEGTTLEKEVANNTNPEHLLENVHLRDIIINDLQGKRISYSTPIGLDGLTTFLKWSGSILQISYYPSGQFDTEFENIIQSVKSTKR